MICSALLKYMDLNPFVWTKTFCGRLSLVLTTEKDAISHQKIALQIKTFDMLPTDNLAGLYIQN